METTVLERLTKDLKVHLFHENFLSYTIAYCLVHKGTEDGTVRGVIHFEFEYYPENLYNIHIQVGDDVYVHNGEDFHQWSDLKITGYNFEDVLTKVLEKVNSDSNLEVSIKFVNACYAF